MTPGTIVICTDARLSEGRLKEGWRYVVKKVSYKKSTDKDCTGSAIVSDGIIVQLVAVLAPWANGVESSWWKSSRFRPLERKEIEDKINSVIADKILAELAKED